MILKYNCCITEHEKCLIKQCEESLKLQSIHDETAQIQNGKLEEKNIIKKVSY